MLHAVGGLWLDCSRSRWPPPPYQTVVFINLPQDDKLVSASQFLYSIAILLSTPLQLFPAVRIMENGLFAPAKSGKRSLKVKWEKNSFRTLAVVGCSILAWAGAKDLDKFVSLIGSVAWCVSKSALLLRARGQAAADPRSARDTPQRPPRVRLPAAAAPQGLRAHAQAEGDRHRAPHIRSRGGRLLVDSDGAPPFLPLPPLQCAVLVLTPERRAQIQMFLSGGEGAGPTFGKCPPPS